MSRNYFITGIGTGVGKTLVTAALIHQLQNKKKNVIALKPVISGFDEQNIGCDTNILSSLLPDMAIEQISPWRLKAPVSPHLAAAKEEQKLDIDAIAAFCQQKRDADIVLAEGVGGIMVPLNETHTTLDLMHKLKWPVILVGGTYLGSINHTLLSVKMLEYCNPAIESMIISESDCNALTLEEAMQTYRRFLPNLRTLALPRVIGDNETWRHAADITGALRGI